MLFCVHNIYSQLHCFSLVRSTCWYPSIHLLVYCLLFDYSDKLLFVFSFLQSKDGNAKTSQSLRIKSRKRCRRISTTVELEIAVMFILVVTYFCMQYLFIIIPFAYNSSESGSGHISHRNLIWLIIVFVVVCVHIYIHSCIALV